MIHLSCENVRRLWFVLLWILYIQAAKGQEFTVGYVTYLPRGSSEVAVKKIAVPDISAAGSDTIIVDIPERVASGDAEYAVTAIGTGVGCGSVMEYGKNVPYNIVRIPSTVRDVYAGTFASGTSTYTRNTSLVFLPNNNIKSWPVGMFKDSPLRRLELPEGVWTDIPDDFCRNTPPAEVVLPANCRTIGAYAFAAPDNNKMTILAMKFNYGLRTIADHAFLNTSPITEERKWQNGVNTLTIPSSVTSIGESAFEGMNNISCVEIPGSIKIIPKHAFARWSPSGDVVIGEGVERVEEEAFMENGAKVWSPYGSYYTGVYGYSLPSTIKYVGKDAFKDSKRLQYIIVAATSPPTTDGSFLSDDEFAHVSLYVARSCIYSYQQSGSGWNKFYRVQPFSDYWRSSVTISQNIREAGTVRGGGTYKYGDRVLLSATPSADYRFVGWLRSGVIVSADAEYEIVVPSGDMNILAVFAPKSGVGQARPDDVYTRIYQTPGAYNVSLCLDAMAPHYGADRATDWQFDLSVTEGDSNNSPEAHADVVFTHAHPDKYASETLSERLTANVVEGTFSSEYGISQPSFRLESEYDMDGNLIPSYSLTLRMPIINSKTGVRDTLSYTADVFLRDIDDPTISFMSDGGEINAPRKDNGSTTSPKSEGMSADVANVANSCDIEAMSPMKNGIKAKSPKRSNSIFWEDTYYAETYANGLDLKSGFDVELTVMRSKDGKSEIVESIKNHYGPGELTPDDDIFKGDDGSPDIYLDQNSRYARMHKTLAGNADKGYNYTFNLRARNYNADGTPRGWIQRTIGESTQDVDVSKLDAECKFYDGMASSVQIKDDVTYLDNKSLADFNSKWMYDMRKSYQYDGNYCSWLRNANACSISVFDFPDQWGICQLYQDDSSDSDGKVLLKEGRKSEWRNKTYSFELPKDGKSHNYSLSWPEVGLERKIVITDHTPQLASKYRFDLKLTGAGIDKIEDLYMVYETADGEINEKVIKRGEWAANGTGGKNIDGFIIDEERVITCIVSLTDTVPLGTVHSIPVPSVLNQVNSYRTYLNSTGNDLQSIKNHITLYGVTEMYFRLKDASNGKTIANGISLNEAQGEVLADGTVKLKLRHNRERPIISADGYVPYYFRNGLNVYGNKIDADGYVGYIDADGKITVTLPMRRRVGKRPFDVIGVYCRTPGIDSIKPKYSESSELPWQSARYAGANAKVAYEGSFQPKTYLDWKADESVDVPTIAVTVAYYDTSYKILGDDTGKEDDKVFGPVMSYLNLKSKRQDKSWRIYSAPSLRTMNRLDVFTTRSSIGGAWAENRDIHGYMREASWNFNLVHDPAYKHTIATYVFSPKNIVVQPEQEDTLYLSLSTGDEIMLGTFKNLTENSMYLASEAQTEGPVGEERISGMANMENLDQFNDAYRNFDIDMPKNTAAYNTKKFDGLDIELPTQGALLPFNIGVQKINNDIVVRGILSYNFLPGGPVMDMVDKTDLASDIDKLFFDIQRSVTRDDAEYAREDRALGFSTAFVGVRGWLEGRLAQNRLGYWVPQAVGMGIKAEASGFFNSCVYSPFFKANLTLGGELSTYAAIDAAPDTTGLGWAVNENAKYLADMVQHTTVSMNTTFSVGAGIDLYIARALCGVKGSLSASFDSEVRYRPYLQGARKIYDAMEEKPEIGVPSSYTYSGSRMQVAGYVKAFAEAKFLWWKVRKEATLASFDKKWYDPDNYSNPLWVADHNEAKTQTVLRSSAYRPLRLATAPENTNIILRDIDTYAEPRYLFGGKDLAYYKINASDMTDAHILFRSGGAFNGGKGEPIVTADVSSTGSRGIIAYEVSTAEAAKIADEKEAPKHMGIKASVNNGSGWGSPVMLTDAHPANYTPRTAIDEDGNAAVAWKGGEFLASDYNDADKAGMVSGALYMRRYDGSGWGNAVMLAPTGKGRAMSDYAMAMLGGKPYMLAALGRNTDEGNGLDMEYTLAAVGYASDDCPMLVESSVQASAPQLVSFGDKLFGAALVKEGGATEDGDTTELKTDVHLYRISTDGMIDDLGGMGLGKRNIADFRLVKSDKAMALIWRESTQILNEQTGQLDITPSVYGALLRSAKGNAGNTVYFISCPQLIAKAENGLDISFYDAYLPDESSMTGVVTLYDSDTGGANVVESTNYFDNDFTIRHAGIDTKVERGSDYGYYVVVFNEGKDVIDYVDLQFGDDAVKHTVQTCIYPGHDAVLTDEALYTASLENGIEPMVTPHFNESALKARTYAEAKAATAGARMVNRRRASRRLKAPVAMPKVQLQVVDIDVSPLSVLVAGSDNYYEASADTLISVPDVEPGEYSDQLPDDYTTVLLNVMNDSPIRLKPGYTTNISLYYDIKGQRPYEYAHGVEIPAAQFEADGGSTVARILVGKVPESVMLFAVAHTTDAEGNIVKDQNMVNNASPVRLERNSLEEVPDGIDVVVADKDADIQPPFKVCRTEGGALVSGLAEGQTLRVYDMSGSMLHLYLEKSAGGQHLVRLGKHGVYLFSVGKHTVKLAF